MLRRAFGGVSSKGLGTMQTVSMRRSVAAPIDEVFDWIADGTNWASVPGMFYSRVQPADGPDPNGVGSIREFASVASKITEVVTGFERPRYMSYKALSMIPRIEHAGGSITFQEIPGGTEVFWTTTFRMTAPVFSGLLTRLYARLVPMGMEGVTRTAERALTR
jgi:hypothetical protein